MAKVIYPDYNVKVSDYDHLKEEELLVSNIFLTLQGEGPFAGRRAVFVRLAGCNLGGKSVNGAGCKFCDSDFRMSESKKNTFAEVISQIRNLHPTIDLVGSNELIVLTGGEPLLQRNIGGLIRAFRKQWRTADIQIESNATQYADVADAYLVLSPKVPETPHKKLGYGRIPGVLWERADCLKVLVSACPDSPYHEIPDLAYRFRDTGRSVYLSPINVYERTPGRTSTLFGDDIYNVEACQRNHQYAAQLCIDEGFRLSVQTHLLAGLE